ncbi:cyclin-dependent kinase inhibitor 1B-like [Thunnus albacares]|uniref:cyclin-dependent kinase inhibitor 1Ba n=1 Tax=Thunnus maccoyii TaxID=8240 RepID=UPI001C4D84F4|nr:cyclin-dependent kinase inhibitor 1Ba [Thunnus maccoyii]XP_044199359.1 cyclin-dependent kinase inhibitor 1B-like [Thunnus albacares]
MCNKMSDVRLSNASPTLERVDARQPDNVRPPVRRNLFGSPDREELRRYMTATIQDEVQGFVETYNFDPVNNRPTSPGNFEWQEDSDAPEFYRRPPHGSQRPQRNVDLPVDDRQDAVEENERQSVRLQNRDGSRKRPSGDSGPCSSECQSKRSHTDEDDDDDPSGGAGNQAVKAVEETHSRPDNSAEVQ